MTLRFHPRDMAEIRVFHGDPFLCQAVCPEVAGADGSSSSNFFAHGAGVGAEAPPFYETGQNTVDTLLELKRGEPSGEAATPKQVDEEEYTRPTSRSPTQALEKRIVSPLKMKTVFRGVLQAVQVHPLLSKTGQSLYRL